MNRALGEGCARQGECRNRATGKDVAPAMSPAMILACSSSQGAAAGAAPCPPCPARPALPGWGRTVHRCSGCCPQQVLARHLVLGLQHVEKVLGEAQPSAGQCQGCLSLQG